MKTFQLIATEILVKKLGDVGRLFLEKRKKNIIRFYLKINVLDDFLGWDTKNKPNVRPSRLINLTKNSS